MAPLQFPTDDDECPCGGSRSPSPQHPPTSTTAKKASPSPPQTAMASTRRRSHVFACLALLLSTGLCSEAFATPLGLPPYLHGTARGGADAVRRPRSSGGGSGKKASMKASLEDDPQKMYNGQAEAKKKGEGQLPAEHKLEIEHLNLPTVQRQQQQQHQQPQQQQMEGAGGGPDSAGVIPVEYVAETNLPTDVGHFRLRAYRIPRPYPTTAGMGTEPCVIYCTDKPPFGIKGGRSGGVGTTQTEVIKAAEDVPVRIHDQCFTSEVFRSQRCDCKEQLKLALEYVQEHGGAIIYLQQEGRGIGLANKVAAYALQDVGMDTVDANIHLGFPEDCRQYGVVPSILEDMGIRSIRLMTNNPRKLERMRALGVEVSDTVPVVVKQANPYNERYLQTKRERMAHQNFSEMLRQPLRPVTATEAAMTSMNGMMAGRRGVMGGKSSSEEHPSVAEDFINEGEEMAAAAITSALVDDGEDDDERALSPLEGVTAKDDGYCFGRRSVEDAISAMANGEMVVVVDDMDRENEGDFIMAADLCTPEAMAEIVRYSSGVICVGMEGERMDELNLPAMVTKNEDPKGTAFAVTVDASKEHGISTGISASDRAITMRLLGSAKCKPSDLVRPGHIFPLRARDGGVLGRDGHTEAAVDLCKLAGRYPAGVLCEIVSEENPTGMARLPELRRFCQQKGYVLTSIVDIAQYRRDTEGK